MTDLKDLHIAIIGAGMGGLGCALSLAKKGFTRISVYETASNLGFVGAGIQLAPNMARILDRLGCWREIEAEATNVKEASIRQGSTDTVLTHVPMPDIATKYGYPHCTGHRSSLAGGMYAACQREPSITFHFASPLARIESFSPPRFSILPRGTTTECPVSPDILLAADGIKSLVRDSMMSTLGLKAEEEATGQAAYRIMLTREQLAPHPDLIELLDSDMVVRWIGERRHIIAYPVSSHNIYNLSSAQPDTNFTGENGPDAAYTTRGSKEGMLRVYEDFCPLVQKMLNLVPEGEVCEWRLRQHKALPTWVEGRTALLGDACHPTLPHLSQGAAMAIEDGAVLAEVLSYPLPSTSSPSTNGQANGEASGNGGKTDEIYKRLKVYELLRKDRTTTLVDLALASGRALHLGEGKAKEERDRQFKEGGGGTKPIPDKWASPEVQEMIYGYDCVEEVRANFERLYAGLG